VPIYLVPQSNGCLADPRNAGGVFSAKNYYRTTPSRTRAYSPHAGVTHSPAPPRKARNTGRLPQRAAVGGRASRKTRSLPPKAGHSPLAASGNMGHRNTGVFPNGQLFATWAPPRTVATQT